MEILHNPLYNLNYCGYVNNVPIMVFIRNKGTASIWIMPTKDQFEYFSGQANWYQQN